MTLNHLQRWVTCSAGFAVIREDSPILRRQILQVQYLSAMSSIMLPEQYKTGR